MLVVARGVEFPQAASASGVASTSTSVRVFTSAASPFELGFIQPRSYVLAETDGTVGTVCIYQRSSPEAIRDHAQRAGLPADEIIEVADTVLVRPDPAPASV